MVGIKCYWNIKGEQMANLHQQMVPLYFLSLQFWSFLMPIEMLYWSNFIIIKYLMKSQKGWVFAQRCRQKIVYIVVYTAQYVFTQEIIFIRQMLHFSENKLHIIHMMYMFYDISSFPLLSTHIINSLVSFLNHISINVNSTT